MIERHHKPKEIEFVIKDIDKFEKRIPKKIASIKKFNGEEVLGNSIQDALDAFARAVTAELDHEKIVRYLTILKEFGTANFAYVMRIEEPFAVTIDGDTFELTGAHKTDYVDTGTWEKAFYSAVILRDVAAIEVLNAVDETVFFNANLKCDRFDLALVNLMQGLFAPNADIGALLEAALKADDIDQGRLRYANKILLPLLPVYRCIFTPDAEVPFNTAMRDALKQHKDYWKRDKYDKQGWISLPLIAAAVIAHDHKGYQLEFETDYIPNWLVERDF